MITTYIVGAVITLLVSVVAVARIPESKEGSGMIVLLSIIILIASVVWPATWAVVLVIVAIRLVQKRSEKAANQPAR